MKKIGSFFINIIVIILVLVLSVLIGLRLFFEPVSMTIFVNHILGEDSFWEELNLEESGFKNFVHDEDIHKEFGKFVSDYIKYIGGANDASKPSIAGFRKLCDKYIEEYEKETGVRIDKDEINEYLDELEEELDEELFVEDSDEDIKTLFDIIYSNVILLVIIVIILGFVGIDYLLRKDLSIVSLHVGIVSILNTSLFFSISLLLKSMTDLNVMETAITAMVVNICNKIGLIGLIFGVVLIALFIKFKNKNKNQNNNMNNQYNQNYMHSNYNNNQNNMY